HEDVIHDAVPVVVVVPDVEPGHGDEAVEDVGGEVAVAAALGLVAVVVAGGVRAEEHLRLAAGVARPAVAGEAVRPARAALRLPVEVGRERGVLRRGAGYGLGRRREEVAGERGELPRGDRAAVGRAVGPLRPAGGIPGEADDDEEGAEGVLAGDEGAVVVAEGGTRRGRLRRAAAREERAEEGRDEE